jgi:hypothetical protein
MRDVRVACEPVRRDAKLIRAISRFGNRTTYWYRLVEVSSRCFSSDHIVARTSTHNLALVAVSVTALLTWESEEQSELYNCTSS